jgi:hypothetical protein
MPLLPPDDKLDITVGIPECRQEDYASLLSVLEDARDMPGTWELFMKLTQERENLWKDRAQFVTRIDVKINDFIEWCSVAEKHVDTKALQQFVTRAATEVQRAHRIHLTLLLF